MDPEDGDPGAFDQSRWMKTAPDGEGPELPGLDSDVDEYLEQLNKSVCAFFCVCVLYRRCVCLWCVYICIYVYIYICIYVCM